MKRNSRAIVLLVAVLGACADGPSNGDGGRSLSGILGANDVGGFAKAEAHREFDFPADHGAHPEFRSEWWYLTAVLQSGGREFGVQFTLFRQALAPDVSGGGDWRNGQVFMGHLAVSDVERQRHVAFERISRGHPALVSVSAEPFRAHIEGWDLASSGVAFSPIRLFARNADLGLDIGFTMTKPVVLQGDRGLSWKGPENASYYYSVPRLEARGTIELAGETFDVRGIGWLDREWSTSVLDAQYAGWDWFALALDDGRDLVFFRLRRKDRRNDAFASGLVIARDGSSSPIPAGALALTVERRWAGWPVEWSLRLGDEAFRIEAAFDDQVMDTSVRYWEGVVHVSGRETAGVGYMELTGY